MTPPLLIWAGTAAASDQEHGEPEASTTRLVLQDFSVSACHVPPVPSRPRTLAGTLSLSSGRSMGSRPTCEDVRGSTCGEGRQTPHAQMRQPNALGGLAQVTITRA